MGSYILCQTQRTEVPFYIENISTNIYSLEELCYFLYHNLYLIDQTVIREELCTWIDEELHLPGLAARLRPHLGKFADIEDFLYPVFKEINYLTYEELRDLNARLAKMDEEPLRLRKKKKGDALAENGMYVNAIQEYQELLKREADADEERSDEERLLDSAISHNLGCAYARLFQMEKAVECFWNAFLFSGNDRDLKTYLLAFRSIRTPLEYESRLAEVEAGDEITEQINAELDRFARLPETPVYGRNMDTILEQLTKEYHRSTGS